jgi:hypothetical protein
LNPELLAARWTCHDIYGEEMPAIAADLLGAGYDTPSLRRLAGETQITCSADAQPLVESVFRELGVPYPLSERQARLVAARQVAREVIAGEEEPWAAAYRIEITVFQWIPDESEIETIFSISDERYWDPPDGRPLFALEEALLETFSLLAQMPDERIFRI